MKSKRHSSDPCPTIPDSFAHASVVHEIAKMAEKQGPEDVSSCEVHETAEAVRAKAPDHRVEYKSPNLVARDVVASGQSSDAFGWQLEARAWQLNFPSASRQAFVADGAKTNWRVQRYPSRRLHRSPI